MTEIETPGTGAPRTGAAGFFGGPVSREQQADMERQLWSTGGQRQPAPANTPPTAAPTTGAPPAASTIESLWAPAEQKAGPAHARRQRGRLGLEVGKPRIGKPRAGKPGAGEAKKGLVSGTGVVVDGTVAYRAVVEAGRVVSYRSFEAPGPTEALRAALEGTKGAKVVVLGGLLFKADVELGQPNRWRAALALVAAGTSAWPAANIAAVAALTVGAGTAETGRSALAGLEGPVPEGFWGALERAGATARPLPFVLGDGAWFVVGREASWLVTVAEGCPGAYRELRAGAKALPQAASMAAVELSRLGKAGNRAQAAQPPVHVAGVPAGPQTAEALSRAGLRTEPPPLEGVERWDIPVVEQGAALLAVCAATAPAPPRSWYTPPEVLAKAAEAPAKRRRAAVTGLVTAVALAIAASGVLPMLKARQQLTTASSALRAAAEDKASVSKWAGLRAKAIADDHMVSQVRGSNPSYSAALALLTGTAPAGAKLTSVVATPPVASSSVPGAGGPQGAGAVDMNVQATVKSATFGPVAAWQSRLEAVGASVQVSSESVLKGTVSLTMTVAIAPKTGAQGRGAS